MLEMLTFRWGGSLFYKNYENLSRLKYLAIILQQVLRFCACTWSFQIIRYLLGLTEEREIANVNNFDWDNTIAEQNKNESLK